MENKRHYQNPPVREVICEFRFDEKSEWDATIPGLIYDELKEAYPLKKRSNEVEITNEGSTSRSVQMSDRIQFFNEQENAAIQIAPNLLVINLLAPYTNWDNYLGMIERVFTTYKKIANPLDIVHSKLHYINEIKFTQDVVELDKYLNFVPFLGGNLPGDYSSFILGVKIPYEEEKDYLRIQMQNGKSHNLILDLAYTNNQIETVNFENMFVWLNKAHDNIIETFENCIKDDLRKTFVEV
ncbi:TIGR04255 family protein [Priestia megaterium]|uniref:TIGR04255 family protein n=1 Tax=Priestia megaterium (strain ATCC 14581 / DSM 32 / CCUG 1817 / JCM 2506 / NBRC 15308 / NCIMB 9376 / NCTC 10342 / NRRL B-14308 / VKM B-512 / Ford 19) TaxID=1348623 RepID=A0A0B6AML3_PRIM2|nr:TIGR04255 family protein [Priestia megaterium]AJI21059.1 hypothetical protein BG04_1419 [Priestia megaterium NBRC 15308 = ATCC 14581]KGJ84253.1 hypothetical protein BMT_13340 [Priestia megaterium NBRC 15308 = ATCC 14581]MDR4230476.1 TIGR04255 family protein [Priestia megaterium]MED3805629.1 TIGR04255 family protein [Priestia megaterium]MED4396343.1 TIGR04255 family protein [Priestia megaterium]